MAQAEWDQIVDLFHAVREKSGSERLLLLDAVCGTNTQLRKAVEEMLREDEAANGFLSEPLFGSRSRELHQSRIVPGQHVGRYITIKLIGRGGMGEVWSAQDSDLDRIVALKFLSSEALAAFDSHQMIREAKAASALNHPGIVTIHEVVQAESQMAMVMELVEGTSLREVMGQPLPMTKVLAIGFQMAEALAAAHAGGIIHGDIKPENIFLRQDQHVKVLDFGLARKVTAGTIASGGSFALGTLRYLSPEQARGELLTPASDIFSFGLVLYELATGQHAFAASSSLDTAQAILTGKPHPPSSVHAAVPSRLNLLLRAMLAKEAVGRPSASDVAQVLRELQVPAKASARSIPTVWKWMMTAIVLVAACFAVWRWEQAGEKRNTPVFRQITTLVPENRATAAAISPDGKWAAYANVDGIFLRTIQNGEVKALSAPANYVVDRLAWFADGTKLVASGFSTVTNVPSIWIISVTGAAPRLVRRLAREALPSPDGTQIAFVSQDRSEIWVEAVNGEQARPIVAGQPAEDRFPFVLWSPDGKRLNFERRHFSPGHRGPYAALDADYLWTYESVDLAMRRIVSKMPSELMSSAAALLDGRIMYLKFDNDFNAARQLWEVNTDLRTGAFLGPPRKIASLLADKYETLIGLSTTADGKRAMALRRSDQNTIFVGDFDPFVPRINGARRLTLDERTSYPHAWTADSRAVIFESNRNGNFDLFKQYIYRRTPENIVASPATEMLPQLAPDGRTLLYAIRPDDAKPWVYILMRVPVEGGKPEEVPIGGSLDEFRCALDPGKRCVLRTTTKGQYYAYYDLDPIRGKGRELARTKWQPGILGDWDVSPDGTQIAIPNHDSHEARIRVLALAEKSNEPKEREVVLKGLTDLRGLVWAANGDAWFVSVDTSIGNRLLYVHLDGRFQPLGDIQGWAVPSPDGRRIAFLDRIVATNAWLIERR